MNLLSLTPSCLSLQALSRISARNCGPFFVAAILAGGISIGASSALADPKLERGRLADGRAYRMDREGMRLSDYLAELEVTTDDLKRQILALEDEVDLKQKKIDDLTTQLKTGKPPKSFAESDLKQPSGMTLPTARRVAEPTAESSVVKDMPVVACNQPDPALLCDAHCEAHCETHCQSKTESLSAKVSQLEGQLRETTLAAEAAAKATLSRAEPVKVFEANPAAAVNPGVNPTVNQPPRAALNISASKGGVAATSSVDLSLVSPGPSSKIEGGAKESSASEIDAEQMRIVKKEIEATLSRVQSLVIKRKDLYDSLKSKPKGVSLELRPLVSQSGETLDSFRAKSAALRPTDQVSEIKRGLVQIESLLTEDIELLKRLSFGR